MIRTAPGTGNGNNDEPFETFFQGWLVRLEHFLQELLQSLQRNNDENDEEEYELRLKDLISRVNSHYNLYNEAKSSVAREDVFLVFSQTWFTPFERSFLWIAGFKPGLVFRFVNSSVVDLSEEQSGRMERLVEEKRAEEKGLEEELARIQRGSVAEEPMLVLARREVDWRIGDVERATEGLRTAMETLVECADYLRGKTVTKVMEILGSAQTVKFLAAAAQFHLSIRSWGLQRQRRTLRTVVDPET